MKIVEQHIIGKHHPFYKECDSLCFKSKNIYNYSLYLIKNDLDKNSYDVLNNLYHFVKEQDCFKDLPNKVSTEVIRNIQVIYKSYFSACKSFKLNPEKFNSPPEQPKFKHKIKGRFVVGYNNQALSRIEFRKTGKLKLSKTNIIIETKIKKFDDINMVRIVPKKNHYVIEVVYTKLEQPIKQDNNRYVAIDLGLTNLTTITTNIKELTPFIIKGTPLKSINQYYNKKLSKLNSILDKRNKKKTSKNTHKLTNKRNRKIGDYLHKVSKYLVTEFKNNDISKVIVGKNDNWKQNINIGSVNNQSFVNIPHSRFIDMLTYKCKLEGIDIVITEESYTSKSSFLDLDKIPKYNHIDAKSFKFSGSRVKRGLYKSKKKGLINADVNGSYNIMRKVIPEVFADGIEGFVVNPKIIKILK